MGGGLHEVSFEERAVVRDGQAGVYDPDYQPELGETLFQSLDRITEQFPDREALVDGDRRFTFTQYRACATRLAAHLHRLGVKVGDRVVSILPTWAEASFGWYGTAAIGGVWVPLSLAYREREIRYILASVEPKAVIVVDSFGGFNHQEMVRRLLPEFPFVRHVLVKGQAREGTISLDQLMARDPGVGDELEWTRQQFNPAANLADTLCLIVHTSGTTGEPKGVMHTHNTVLSAYKSSVRVTGTTEKDVCLLPLPLGNSFGILCGTVAAYAAGAKVVLQDGFEPGRFLETIQRERATFLVGVPAMFKAVLNHPDFDRYDVSSVRTGYVAGAASAPEDRIACIDRLGEILSMYGSSETVISSVATFDDPLDIKARSVGRVFPGSKAKIVDDSGRTLPPGEPGELWLGGPFVTPGYWNQPELNAQKFTPDGWFKIGDIGTMDEEGHIFLVGRVDDRIVRGGHKIYPVEVEGLLSTHPKISQCCLIALPDPALGECTVACIKVRAGEDLSAQEVRGFCRGKIAEYLVPDFVEIMDSIPMSPTGKILYRQVRQAVSESRSQERQSLSAEGQVRAKARTDYVTPRDALESRLAEIWESILGIAPIGVNDDFFDLGGRSVLAMQLAAQVGKVFGREIPVTVIFAEPTIERLANVIRQEGCTGPHPSLVAIRPGDSAPPFFCVHGVNGALQGIGKIFRHLGQGLPVYGLRSQGLYEDRVAHTSIEEMAAHYVTEVQQVQPQGPYYLAGHSFGGVVAFELARQLRARGQEVALLALIDVYRPDYVRMAPIPRRIGVHFRNLLRFGPREGLKYLQERQKYLKPRLMGLRERVKLRTLSNISGAWPFTRRRRASALHLGEANRSAFRQYVPQPYEGRVTLFFAAEDPLVQCFATDPRLAWRELALEGLEIQACPGSHLTMLEEPHIRVLAERLTACLLEAQSRPSNGRASDALGSALLS